MSPRSSYKRPGRGSPGKKAAIAVATKLVATQLKKQQLQQQLLELQQTNEDTPSLVASPQPISCTPDRRVGQRIGMRLRNLLKLTKARKWVCYEWFYSNIDKYVLLPPE